jgi:predicted GH43/DUF377 family glycosyl hydrolase
MMDNVTRSFGGCASSIIKEDLAVKPLYSEWKNSNVFNWSSIEFNNNRYNAYRFYDTILLENSLDSNVVKLQNAEDPRLFIHNSSIYMSYTDLSYKGKPRVGISKYEKGSFTKINIDKHNKTTREKNWMFFSNNNKLYYVYSVSKKFIIRGIDDDSEYVHDGFLKNWKYGDLHGGSPPIIIGNTYYSIIHSKNTENINEFPCSVYHNTLVGFSTTPPFNKKLEVDCPIISSVSNESYREHLKTKIFKKLFCVFITTMEIKNGEIILYYGYNDKTCRKMTFDIKQFFNSIIKYTHEY